MKSTGKNTTFKPYFIYMLKCADGSLYTGYTTDISHRLHEHQKGRGSKYVRSRLPVKLVYYEAYSSKEAAMKREAEIKKLSRQQKLKLINND